MNESTIRLPHIFKHWNQLQQQLKNTSCALLGFDFDGTLAPIVDEPDKAHILDENRQRLERLTTIAGVSVAVLSGRSLNDLKKRVPSPQIIRAGDHGLKIELTNGRVYQPIKQLPMADMKRAQERIQTIIARFEGVHLDVKDISLTVHYRQAPAGTGELLKKLLKDALQETRVSLKPGRLCWEIHPYVNWHKGKAYQWINQQVCGASGTDLQLYIGDDRTDEDVFKILQTTGFPILILSREKTGGTSARYRLDSQDEMGIFLQKLLESLRRGQS